MTKQDFNKLIEAGFITDIWVADKFLNDEKLLNELTLSKLREMGAVTKTVCFDFEEESVVEVTEEPVTTIEPVTVTEEPVKKSSKKVEVTEEPATTIEPVTVTEEPKDIVVDEGEDE